MESAPRKLAGVSILHEGKVIFIPLAANVPLSHFIVNKPREVTDLVGSVEGGLVLCKCSSEGGSHCLWEIESGKTTVLEGIYTENCMGIATRENGSTAIVLVGDVEPSGYVSLASCHGEEQHWEEAYSAFLGKGTDILQHSLVSCDGWSYWRTAMGRREGMLGYHPETRRFVRAKRPGNNGDGRWQLADVAGSLYAIAVRKGHLEWYSLASVESQCRWLLKGTISILVKRGARDLHDGKTIEYGQTPEPLRSSSSRLEIVVWIGNKFLVVEEETSRRERTYSFRYIPYLGPTPPRMQDAEAHRFLLPAAIAPTSEDQPPQES